jgi:hypothetical protein
MSTDPQMSTDQMNLDTLDNTAKGRLWIKVIESRQLLCKSVYSRPYCVVEFEKNEFVTREATELIIHNSDDQSLTPAPFHQFTDVQSQEYGFHVGPPSDNIGLNACWKHEAAFDVSRDDSIITIVIFDRAAGKDETFLGCMRIKAPKIAGKLFDNWFKLLPRQADEPVRGDLRMQVLFFNVAPKSLSASDFELLKVVYFVILL